ncbi:MAG: hypothetical protein KJ698_06895 [Actinobacteria bacterium]|nr:hypothetical protein [Actinomycetota bacterium]MBU1494394.1 hypothetical protein [Actinomycetota bacterium]MBU1864929.1 hypothetical protein [Actinomycetota bacterium]
MSNRQITILIWAGLAVAMLLLEALSRRRRSRIPSFGALVTRGMRTASGRVAVLAGWLWIGLHYFSR